MEQPPGSNIGCCPEGAVLCEESRAADGLDDLVEERMKLVPGREPFNPADEGQTYIGERRQGLVVV